jgi:hypothetical protein
LDIQAEWKAPIAELRKLAEAEVGESEAQSGVDTSAGPSSNDEPPAVPAVMDQLIPDNFARCAHAWITCMFASAYLQLRCRQVASLGFGDGLTEVDAEALLSFVSSGLGGMDFPEEGPPPASREARHNLAIKSLSEASSCSVCLEQFKSGSKAKVMPCGHPE